MHDGIFDVYGHFGFSPSSTGYSSLTAGKVYGYEKQGDLAGGTFDMGFGDFGGVDYSSNLESFDSNVTTFGLSVSYGGSVYLGYDYYWFWG